MNKKLTNKETKTLRKYAKLTGLIAGDVYKVYEQGDEKQRAKDMLEIISTINAILEKRKEVKSNGNVKSV